eukprot:5944494-Pyramimonas_sp.AAC.1
MDWTSSLCVESSIKVLRDLFPSTLGPIGIPRSVTQSQYPRTVQPRRRSVHSTAPAGPATCPQPNPRGVQEGFKTLAHLSSRRPVSMQRKAPHQEGAVLAAKVGSVLGSPPSWN